jgi:hypothetical protein
MLCSVQSVIEIPASAIVEDGAIFQKSWVPTGPETKTDCTGEGRQQINTPLSIYMILSWNWFNNLQYQTQLQTAWFNSTYVGTFCEKFSIASKEAFA